ncbi:hypothetical protein REPUB_Repub07fG0199400 [Reevesia pubescens]
MEIFAQKLTPCTSKKQKRDFHAQDRISELPDDVLIFILSRMPMKAAAKTSVLSHRWEKLWTFTQLLEFDGSKTLLNIQFQIKGFENDHDRVKKILELERAKYISWVNHIVESYHIPAIDEFRIRFDLDENYKCNIDEWVRFAFRKKVKRFELDVSDFQGFVYDKDFCYPLYSQTLGLSSFISLTSLVLKQVNVSGEVLDNFISNSPFLERLCVGGSRSLVHLRVAGPSLYLKCLEIINCWGLESIELDAANLLSLKYSGPNIEIPFMNVPNLTELFIKGLYVHYFTRKLPQISTFFSQLRKLALGFGYTEVIQKKMKRLEYPILSHLKQLELEISAHDDDSLLFLSSLIKACPFLNRLSLELRWFEPYLKRKVRKARKSPHHNLKVVEMTGFVGQTIDTEFCMYLIENAIMLEKIIIDPCPLFAKGGPYENHYYSEVIKAVRDCAEQLKSKYLLGDKLVIM